MLNPIRDNLVQSLREPLQLIRVEPEIATLSVVFHFENGESRRFENIAPDRAQFLVYWKDTVTWWRAVLIARLDPENPE
jgi:hypothetical protein